MPGGLLALLADFRAGRLARLEPVAEGAGAPLVRLRGERLTTRRGAVRVEVRESACRR